MVFDGHYGTPGPRRQRYRCHPPDGEKWHRFTPPVPRQDAVGGECEHCERELHTHEGPHTPRESLFSARDVALGLVEVGRGRDLSRRVSAGAHSGVFEPYSPALWPDGTLVLDPVPFRVKAYASNGRPIPGGVVAFNVFGALAYHDGRGLLCRLQRSTVLAPTTGSRSCARWTANRSAWWVTPTERGGAASRAGATRRARCRRWGRSN